MTKQQTVTNGSSIPTSCVSVCLSPPEKVQEQAVQEKVQEQGSQGLETLGTGPVAVTEVQQQEMQEGPGKEVT